MCRYFLLLAFAISLSGYCQEYARSPFYSPAADIPSTARVEGYEHGGFKANGVGIDLSESAPESSPDFEKIAGWSIAADVDGSKPAQLFQFYIQYDRLKVTFGYDLLVEPIEGTDRIRCTFSALTDPQGWTRFRDGEKEIVPVALPADLTPLVVRFGDVISIPTLPLGEGRIAVVHYLRLTRTEPASESVQQ